MESSQAKNEKAENTKRATDAEISRAPTSESSQKVLPLRCAGTEKGIDKRKQIAKINLNAIVC